MVEAEGDFDKAVENLRKKGQKVVANRADRDSAEGAVLAKVNDDNTAGVVVSVNCETDFVAKNESYLDLANQILDLALEAQSLEALLAADFGGMTVAEKLTEQTGVIGEKIEIGGFKRIEGTCWSLYSRWEQNSNSCWSICKCRRWVEAAKTWPCKQQL